MPSPHTAAYLAVCTDSINGCLAVLPTWIVVAALLWRERRAAAVICVARIRLKEHCRRVHARVSRVNTALFNAKSAAACLALITALAQADLQRAWLDSMGIIYTGRTNNTYCVTIIRIASMTLTAPTTTLARNTQQRINGDRQPPGGAWQPGGVA